MTSRFMNVYDAAHVDIDAEGADSSVRVREGVEVIVGSAALVHVAVRVAVPYGYVVSHDTYAVDDWAARGYQLLAYHCDAAVRKHVEISRVFDGQTAATMV